MKIFFSTSPRAKQDYSQEIERIYNYFDSVKVHLTDDVIRNISEEEFYSWDAEQRKKYYKDTIRAIKKAEVCIFEATYPSLGVGHLINQALHFGKQVIVLYTDGKKPFMLDSSASDKIVILAYDRETLEEILASALEYAKGNKDVRFDFYISPEIGEYLNKVSREKRIPRSVFLRGLIEEHMKAVADDLLS
ncbi:MAG: hypothetical protein GW947_02130 [Candidatus Pacebacteria bacterium]|nr:hypothetical protein [Candidatus Paceibacterota bacterium]